ncbi:MAG: proton-conducting transporter membrane subunit [Candidatus Bathyarchaeia archaeon]|jgi:hydrogenase-4 component F
MMLSAETILAIYAVLGLIVVLLTILFKTHKSINILSVILPAGFIILSLYSLGFAEVPNYSVVGGYFLIDHLGIYEVLISSVLFLAAAVYARSYIEGSIEIGEMDQNNLKLFYVALNLLLVEITFTFFSNNLALFWILAELTTAFSGVLIVMLNAVKNIGATLKYIFITSTCMLFSFIGLILLFTLTENSLGVGTLNWNTLMNVASTLSPAIIFAAFIFTFVGFAAKSGVVPFHAWLPSAHSKAPAPVSAILSGSITSVGIYGIIRMYAIAAQTSSIFKVSVFLIAFGVISMLVAALTMLTQVNLKKVIAYSTVENMGFLLVGIGLGTPLAIFWTLFYVLAHAFTKASLFLSSGIIHHQFGGVRLENIKNALKLQPFASWSLILGGIAIIGMPLSAIFLAKISLLIQSTFLSPFLTVGLLFIFLFVAAAFGIFLMKLLTKKETTETKQFHASLAMKLPIAALLLTVFILGVFFPQQLTDLLSKIVVELGIR